MALNNSICRFTGNAIIIRPRSIPGEATFKIDPFPADMQINATGSQNRENHVLIPDGNLILETNRCINSTPLFPVFAHD